MNKRQFLSLVGASLALALPCRADIYLDLTIKGVKYEGTSKSKEFNKKIECMSVQQSVVEPAAVRANPRGEKEVGGVILTITKVYDPNSPLLLQAFLEGATVDGKFSFVKNNKDKFDEYYTIEGKRGRVTSVSMNSGGGDGPPTEQIILSFVDVIWASTPVDDKGTKLKPISYKYPK